MVLLWGVMGAAEVTLQSNPKEFSAVFSEIVRPLSLSVIVGTPCFGL